MAPRREACWCLNCAGKEVTPSTAKRHSDMPRAERAPQQAVYMWRLEYPAFAEACNRERSQAEQAETSIQSPLVVTHAAGANAAAASGGNEAGGDVRDAKLADRTDSNFSDRADRGLAAAKAAWETIMHQDGVPVDNVSAHHLWRSCISMFMATLTQLTSCRCAIASRRATP